MSPPPSSSSRLVYSSPDKCHMYTQAILLVFSVYAMVYNNNAPSHRTNTISVGVDSGLAATVVVGETFYRPFVILCCIPYIQRTLLRSSVPFPSHVYIKRGESNGSCLFAFGVSLLPHWRRHDKQSLLLSATELRSRREAISSRTRNSLQATIYS